MKVANSAGPNPRNRAETAIIKKKNRNGVSRTAGMKTSDSPLISVSSRASKYRAVFKLAMFFDKTTIRPLR
jgi:hypothetical protein